MKTFKEVISEARPQDYVPLQYQDDDEETTTYKPRAKGERQFKDAHVVAKKEHPVAADNQFNGTTDHSGEHSGHDPKTSGEMEFPKQGSSTFTQFMNKNFGKQTPTRKGDKRQGDMKPVMAKEEVELQEGVVDTLKKIAQQNKAMEVKFKNGKTIDVDPKSAKAILKTHESLNSANAKKMRDSLEKGEQSFMKMLDFAMM